MNIKIGIYVYKIKFIKIYIQLIKDDFEYVNYLYLIKFN